MKYLKNILLALIFVMAVWFCLYAVGAFRTRGKNYTLGNNISLIISKELEIHDNKKNVMKFLDACGLHDREIVVVSPTANDDSLVTELGSGLHGIDSAIIVLIPEVESSLTSRYYVIVIFYFDKQQKMIDYKTQKRGIGL